MGARVGRGEGRGTEGSDVHCQAAQNTIVRVTAAGRWKQKLGGEGMDGTLTGLK